MEYKTLYHLTEKENVASILKHGLHPMIGSRAHSVGETDRLIYLTDKDSLPYWSLILNLTQVLEVNTPMSVFENGTSQYHWSLYREYTVSEPIPATCIKKTNRHPVLSEKQHQAFCLDYLLFLSYLCEKFARMITKQETLDDNAYMQIFSTCKTILPILNRMDYHKLSRQQIQDYLKEYADSGAYTLCDRYDVPNSPYTGKKLYELFETHPMATPSMRNLHTWLENTFGDILQIDTGGFTG